MKRIITALSIICGLTSPCMSTSIPDELRTRMSQCGINSLCSCMHYLGIDLKLDQVYNDIEQDEKNEVNLYQLKDYADKLGVAVKPIKRPTLDAVRKYLASNSCAILQFKYPERQAHMVALLRPDDEEVVVCDYPQKKHVISEKRLADLLGHSSGMLILSHTTLQDTVFSKLIHSELVWLSLFMAGAGALTVTVRAGRNKGRSAAPHETPP